MNKYVYLILIPFILTGCSGNSSQDDEQTIDPDIPPVTSGNWYKPEASTSWQWQLTGTVNTGYNVDIYDIDLFETDTGLIQMLQTSGVKVICYFSAGSYENGRPDSADFPASTRGNNLDGFPDEQWLDIRSPEILTIMKTRLQLTVQKGCDGVEPDNMDGYINNSEFNLSADDQLAFNRNIANEAHNRNLSVGLKNDLDQIKKLVSYYDFQVNEQCFEFDERNLLQPFIDANKAVLSAEYLDEYRLT